MKKRILSWILSVALVVTVFPVFASADEIEGMTTSTAGLEMIKEFEGFIRMPMPDGVQWSIGYGSKCDPGDYPNGISEAEADALLLETVSYFEEAVNRYLNAYDISLEQHQFDALISITYNLGVAWINSSYRFWSMLRQGLDQYTDNEIASAIGVWSHVGTSVSEGILQRRITEIRLFLYGDYDGSTSVDFRHAVFHGNGGEIETDVMLYRENEPYGEFPEATRSGYYFAGWYTAANGGTQVRTTDLAVGDLTLYAHWSATPVQVEEPVQTVQPSAGGFRDVQETDWFYQYVLDLTSDGTISGYGDGTYRPDEIVTVGQSLKLILLAAGYEAQAPVSDHWASGYQQLALDLEIASQEEVSDLDAPASRLLVGTMAAKALRIQPTTSRGEFVDTDDGYAEALYYTGIMEGSLDEEGNRWFRPAETVKRSEIAKIVWTMQNW